MTKKNIEIELKTPVKNGEKTITKIKLREPSAGELRGLSLVRVLEFDVDSIATLMPRIATPTLTERQIYEMDVQTFTQVATNLASFFTGETLIA